VFQTTEFIPPQSTGISSYNFVLLDRLPTVPIKLPNMQPKFALSDSLFFTLAFFFVLVLDFNLAIAQSNQTGEQTNWRAERESLEFQFGQELVEIAAWCQQNDLARQVPITYDLKINRDPRRQYIYLPSTKLMPDPNLHEGRLSEWLAKINTAKKNHANRIFKLAKTAANEDAMAIAYQLVHEVIFHDRGHDAVRKMLGHQRQENHWNVAAETFRPRQSKTDHDFLPLRRGEFIIAKTPHFEIESTASEARTQELADDLERWHGVWRQVFFEYWGSRKTLKDAIDGKKVFRTPGRKFKVVFFKNKMDYVANLKDLVRGVEVSSGYYSNKQRVSFFFDGGKSERETWRHELTHQLFRESRGRSPDTAFDKNYIWLDEGVATYFESMTELDGYVTLGGFDALRTQFARKQALLEDRSLPIEQLHALSQSQWQARADADLYAQSAAVVDMMINDNGGRLERALVDLLQIIYKKRTRPDVFSKKLNVKFKDLDQSYAEYLKVDSKMVVDHLLKPESRTFLCLPSANLQTAAFSRLGKCTNLTELCFSQQTVSVSHINELKSCRSLRKLIIVGCVIEPGALESLAEFQSLEEINLTYSEFSPGELATLKSRKPKLKIVR
jgi:hypothetical protein